MQRTTPLKAVIAAFLAIDIVVVLARLVVRVRITKKPGYDDIIIALGLAAFIVMSAFLYTGLGYGYGLTDPEEIAHFANYDAVQGAKYFVWAELAYLSSFPVVRISVGVVLLRISKDTLPVIQRLLWSSIGVIAVYGLALFITDTLQCRPLRKAWLGASVEGHCLTNTQMASLGIAISGLDISSALFYAILPIFMLKGVQMGLRTKIAVLFLLGLGAITVVITVLRLKTIVVIFHTSGNEHLLNAVMESFIFTVLEFAISILTASLVALRPLVKYMPFGSRGRSSNNRSTGYGHGPSNGHSNGTGNFELGRRNRHYSSDAIRLHDDSESQRDMLAESDSHNKVWKHSVVTMTTEDIKEEDRRAAQMKRVAPNM